MTNPTLQKIADLEDRTTAVHHEQYRFNKENGSKGSIILRRSEARDTLGFKRQLDDLGARLPAERKEALAFIETATRTSPRHYRVYAKRAGWLPSNKGFVRAKNCIGQTGNIVGISLPRSSESQGKVGRRGTVKGWRNSVGEIAATSSMMMTAICAAFATPLLKFRGFPTFALCFSGPSRSGKTRGGILAGASVIGIRSPDNLPTWNTTAARLEERLPEFNDTLFPIDDLQNIEGNDKDRYLLIRDLAYRVAQGHGKARFSSFAAGANSVQWRCILVTSHETTIDKLASSAKLRRNDGEKVRLIDVPAVRDDQTHIFDRTAKSENTEWRRETLQALVKGVQCHHGKVFNCYIRKLIKFEQKNHFLDDCRESFVGRVVRPTDSSLVADIAEKFALLYSAGRLALEFRLVPWTESELFDSIKTSYLAARNVLPDETAMFELAVRDLTAFLHALPLQSSTQGDLMKASGYRMEAEKSAFIVKCQAFNAVFRSPLQRRSVLTWLMDTGQIESAKPRRGEAKKPQDQFVWPNKKRLRSYRITLRPLATKNPKHIRE